MTKGISAGESHDEVREILTKLKRGERNIKTAKEIQDRWKKIKRSPTRLESLGNGKIEARRKARKVRQKAEPEATLQVVPMQERYSLGRWWKMSNCGYKVKL